MTSRTDAALRQISPLGNRERRLYDPIEFHRLSRQERRSITRRLSINMFGAGLLAVGLLIERIAPTQVEVSQLVQASAALLVGGAVFSRALQGFFASPPRDFTDQLVAVAVLAALSAGDFLSAALVPLLLELGHLFEERSALGANAAIERLRKLCTRDVTVVTDESEQTVTADEIDVGTTIIVRPGEIIPADGCVLVGHASIDQSPVTGESEPLGVGPDDPVYAGTVNLDGVLRIEVERTGDDSVLGEVIRILREVEETKTPVVRMLEKAAAAYLPIVLAVAALVLVLTSELSRFITVLIVACPCALVLAAPAAMVAAMSATTRKSVLIKNAAFLETIAGVDTLVLDKTGTITDAKQSVDAIRAMEGSEDEVLRLAAAAAYGSQHPASKAIVSEATARNLTCPTSEAFREFAGRGVEATIDSEVVRIGRAAWLAERGVIDIHEEDQAGVWVTRSDRAIGFISLFDHTRVESKSAIQAMRDLGFSRIVLLTGDKASAAQCVSDQLGLDDFFSDVLPAEKLEIVRREQSEGRTVLMVGDGINDALALSAADVGIAVGARVNEVALGGADVAILSNDVSRLPFVVYHADRTRNVITQNVAIGLTFSIGMLGLAAFGVVNPLTGALLHNAGAIFVVFNSARLRDESGHS